MATFLKKALGLFVEFDESNNENPQTTGNTINTGNFKSTGLQTVGTGMGVDELEKFEKYFEQLFEKSNMPGPDYFEFWKMMETLEAHIPDERARITATFAALSAQGLKKENLINTANQYIQIIQTDKQQFEKALGEKVNQEVKQRQQKLTETEALIASHSETIQRLTNEIAEAQALIGKLKTEVIEEENKVRRNSNGYNIACDAMMKKITTDITKIQTTL
jgi:chromosome segregation ATPase